MEKNTKRKVSVEELNELSIVGGNDGNPEPVCSLSNIIITTVLVSLVSISYFTTSPEQCKLIWRIPTSIRITAPSPYRWVERIYVYGRKVLW